MRIHHGYTEEAAHDLRASGCALQFLKLSPATAREQARECARDALRVSLQGYFRCSAHAISITTKPGTAPVVTVEGIHQVYASFSYEAGCALVAIDVRGPVGTDIAPINHHPGWGEECVEVAKAYLPPGVWQHLKSLTTRARATAFAEAWALHEARLKCAGLPLQEWTRDLETPLKEINAFSWAGITGFMVACARQGEGLPA